MRAVFLRKDEEIKAGEFVVEKVIALPKAEYEDFTWNLLKPYDFIKDNLDLMRIEGNVRHCILVTGEGMDEGVLVESEGASYARYAAFVPSISGILQQMEQQNVEHVTENGLEGTGLSMKM